MQRPRQHNGQQHGRQGSRGRFYPQNVLMRPFLSLAATPKLDSGNLGVAYKCPRHEHETSNGLEEIGQIIIISSYQPTLLWILLPNHENVKVQTKVK